MGQRHHPVGHTKCFINRTLAHAVPPKAVSGSPGIAVSHALWCQFQEAAILPWDTEVPSSWSFTLMHSWGIWNWYCGPQTTYFHVKFFTSYPPLTRQDPTQQVAMDAHTLQAAWSWNQPRVLVYDPHGAPVVSDGSLRPEIVAMAPAIVNKS